MKWRMSVVALVMVALLVAQTRIDLRTQARPVTDNAVPVGTGTALAMRVLPNCSGATADKLLYSATTYTFSCGADQTGAAGGVGSILAGHMGFTTVAASTTTYAAHYLGSFNATESYRQWMAPTACTLRNLYMRTATAQSATGALTVTVRLNGAATAITITVAAGGAAGVYSDAADTAAAAAADRVSIQFANAATAVSAQIAELTVQCN